MDDKPTKTVLPNGKEECYLNGLLHREDGPAIVFPNGTQAWFLNGKHHREDGPAVIWPDGTQGWWINGVQISEADFNALRNHKILFGDERQTD
jgi:hypothetical protein